MHQQHDPQPQALMAGQRYAPVSILQPLQVLQHTWSEEHMMCFSRWPAGCDYSCQDNPMEGRGFWSCRGF